MFKHYNNSAVPDASNRINVWLWCNAQWLWINIIFGYVEYHLPSHHMMSFLLKTWVLWQYSSFFMIRRHLHRCKYKEIWAKWVFCNVCIKYNPYLHFFFVHFTLKLFCTNLVQFIKVSICQRLVPQKISVVFTLSQEELALY